MKTKTISRRFVGSIHRLAIAFGTLSVCFAVSLQAQTPCPDVGVIDRTSGRLILSELSTGRLVWLPIPTLTKGGYIYWSNFAGGDIRRANLDGTGQKTLISGLSAPAFLTLDLSPLRAPDLQAVTKSDMALTLNWSALMGRGYQVQFKTDLTQPNWSNLILHLTATNTTMNAFDTATTDPQRFYRVLLLP